MDNKSNKQWVWLALDAVTCEKQLEFALAQEMKHLHKVGGTPYHLFTAKALGRKLPKRALGGKLPPQTSRPKELRANVRSLILTLGQFYRPTDIVR